MERVTRSHIRKAGQHGAGYPDQLSTGRGGRDGGNSGGKTKTKYEMTKAIKLFFLSRSTCSFTHNQHMKYRKGKYRNSRTIYSKEDKCTKRSNYYQLLGMKKKTLIMIWKGRKKMMIERNFTTKEGMGKPTILVSAKILGTINHMSLM